MATVCYHSRVIVDRESATETILPFVASATEEKGEKREGAMQLLPCLHGDMDELVNPGSCKVPWPHTHNISRVLWWSMWGTAGASMQMLA